MKRFLPIVMLLMTGALVAPARADITSRMTSSVQLTVNSAATQMNRIGSSFSISGNNVDTTDGTTANTISAGTVTTQGLLTVTAGGAGTSATGQFVTELQIN